MFGHGIRDAPVERFADRIVSAGQSPGGREIGVLEILAPGFRARFAGRGNVVKLPDILAGERVLRGDEAGVARLAAASAGDHFAFHDDGARGVLRLAGAGLPALLAGAGVQADHVAVGRGVENYVLINGERFGARGAGGGRWNLALVLPDEIAIGGVERFDDGARFHQVHDAVVHDRNGFAGARAQAARPGHAELADVGAIHLLQRAEALRVVGAAVHQPVVRAGMQEHVLRSPERSPSPLARARPHASIAQQKNHESCWPSFYSICDDRITSIGRSRCEVWFYS